MATVAGAEYVTSDGHVQLTANLRPFRLEQKVVLDNTGWSQWGTTGSYRDVTFNGPGSGDAPMLALSSSAGTWSRLTGSTVNSLTYRIYRTSSGGASVTLFLFSKRLPPTDVGPFSLYDASQNCVFNALYPPARPIGVFADGVYTGLDRTGRSLAHVPQKRETAQYNTFTRGSIGSCMVGPYQGYQYYLTTGWAETVVTASGTTLANANITSSVGPVTYACSQDPSAFLSTSGSSAHWSSLILDVTNY